MRSPERGDPPASAAELLVAWRKAERRLALVAGSADGAGLRASMRQLMDEYDWVVRGRIGPPPAGRANANAP